MAARSLTVLENLDERERETPRAGNDSFVNGCLRILQLRLGNAGGEVGVAWDAVGARRGTVDERRVERDEISLAHQHLNCGGGVTFDSIKISLREKC